MRITWVADESEGPPHFSHVTGYVPKWEDGEREYGNVVPILEGGLSEDAPPFSERTSEEDIARLAQTFIRSVNNLGAEVIEESFQVHVFDRFIHHFLVVDDDGEPVLDVAGEKQYERKVLPTLVFYCFGRPRAESVATTPGP